jgi:hypothetical protein
MYLLIRTNVDGYAILEKFTKKPGYKELYEYLFEYFDENQSEAAANSLLKYGYASMGDCSGAEYELEEM